MPFMKDYPVMSGEIRVSSKLDSLKDCNAGYNGVFIHLKNTFSSLQKVSCLNPIIKKPNQNSGQVVESQSHVHRIWCQRNDGKQSSQTQTWDCGPHVGHGAACVLFLNHLSDKARWVVDLECGPLLEAIKKPLLCLGDRTPFLLSPESSLWLQC